MSDHRTASGSSEAPVVLLTGASRGLGLTILSLLLRGTSNLQPAKVVTLSRSHPSALRDLETEFGKTSLECIQGDICKEDDNARAVEAAISRWARLDSVILNAGLLDFGRVGQMPAARFTEMITVNLTSLYLTVSAALPHLQQASSSATSNGTVIFVSSGNAVGNAAGMVGYNVSKAGMNSFARTLASEGAGDKNGKGKIAIWAIRPGVVDTDMQTLIRSSGAEALDTETHERFLKLHADGKLLPAEKPGHVIAALAIRGTREHPKASKADERPSGAVGAFINWDAEELRDFQLP